LPVARRTFLFSRPTPQYTTSWWRTFLGSVAEIRFRGISQFAQTAPNIITGENWEHVAGQLDLLGELGGASINIFNVQKVLERGRIRTLRETIGEGYFDYLAGLPDLVLLMDEAHRYRATAGMQAISELKPILGLEM